MAHSRSIIAVLLIALGSASPCLGQTRDAPLRLQGVPEVPIPRLSPPKPKPGMPAGKRGALWTGTMEYRGDYVLSSGGTYRVTGMVDLRLREYAEPLRIKDGRKQKTVGSITHLVADGGTLNETMVSTSTACTDTGGGMVSLDGPEDSLDTAIWSKSEDVDTTETIGWNVPAGPGVYVLALAPQEAGKRIEYQVEGCPGSRSHTYVGAIVGRQPTGQWNDPEMRTLDDDGNRMVGRYEIAVDGGMLSVSWDVCREGADCAKPAAAATGGESDICPTDPEAARAAGCAPPE